MRTYKNVELKESADKLRIFLKENGIEFETSGCGYGYTHFEILCNDEETQLIKNMLATNY